MSKYSYYNVDTGFFPLATKLCFNKKSFDDILKDYAITPKEDPQSFEMGAAETHSFSNMKESVIIVGINLDTIDDNPASLAGIVAHECSHVIERLLEHIGEEVDEFGEETRAYLLQSLVEQIYTACILEMKANAKRKEARAKARKKGKGEGGPVPEVDKPGDDGGAGPPGDHQRQGETGGNQGREGDPVAEAEPHDVGAGAPGNLGDGPVE